MSKLSLTSVRQSPGLTLYPLRTDGPWRAGTAAAIRLCRLHLSVYFGRAAAGCRRRPRVPNENRSALRDELIFIESAIHQLSCVNRRRHVSSRHKICLVTGRRSVSVEPARPEADLDPRRQIDSTADIGGRQSGEVFHSQSAGRERCDRLVIVASSAQDRTERQEADRSRPDVRAP